MGKFKWTDDKIGFVIKNIGDMPLEDIGMAIGTSHTTVRMKAIEIGLYKPYGKRAREWSEDEISYLREHYRTVPDCDIAHSLGIAPGTVRKKALELGLSKQDGYEVSRFYRRYVNRYANS